MRPRLTEVAARAGVSAKTVSNVINDFPHISTSTRTRVLAAIEELGYVPNVGARNLARGRSGVIVLGVPQLDTPPFASLAMQLIDAAERAGWWVQIRQTHGHRDRELELLDGAGGSRVDGVVLTPVSLDPADVAAGPSAVPTVVLGYRQLGTLDHIGIDDGAAARLAVDHLLQTGRRRIAVVGRPPDICPRARGAVAALQAAGSELATGLRLVVHQVGGPHGEQAMDRHLAGGGALPEAVLCTTDWLATGVIRSLLRHGHRVPADVAVMGWDDIPSDVSTMPTLSTISPDRAQIARLAVESLQRQERDRDDVGRVLLADHTLVVRESTAG